MEKNTELKENLIRGELLKLAEEVSTFEEIQLVDIPCVDLYMDQVTTFFEDKLKLLKREAEEKILTKTMINNYAKAKILTPIKGKKYNKEQILLLTLIYHLKQTLSIQDISKIFSVLLKPREGKKKEPFTEGLYKQFLEVKKQGIKNFTVDFEKKLSEIEEEISLKEDSNSKEKVVILLVLQLINEANMQKRMAEKIIDTYFTKDK